MPTLRRTFVVSAAATLLQLTDFSGPSFEIPKEPRHFVVTKRGTEGTSPSRVYLRGNRFFLPSTLLQSWLSPFHFYRPLTCVQPHVELFSVSFPPTPFHLFPGLFFSLLVASSSVFPRWIHPRSSSIRLSRSPLGTAVFKWPRMMNMLVSLGSQVIAAISVLIFARGVRMAPAEVRTY